MHDSLWTIECSLLASQMLNIYVEPILRNMVIVYNIEILASVCLKLVTLVETMIMYYHKYVKVRFMEVFIEVFMVNPSSWIYR